MHGIQGRVIFYLQLESIFGIFIIQIEYVFRLNNPIIVEDHWIIPFQGGTLRLLSTGSKVTAIEIICKNQPSGYAPSIITNSEDNPKTTIVGNDARLPLVKGMLKSMISYLQCYFGIRISFSDVDVEFSPDQVGEEAKIPVRAMKIERPHLPPPISFDLITRAIMASERSPGPQFEAALINIARESRNDDRFIDSFRYSFLLIESFYGSGKFKNNQLKEELKGNADFRSMVKEAISDPFRSNKFTNLKIEILVKDGSKLDEIIDHLVDQRGFYFHGNVSRKGAWKPQEQGEAEILCELALRIAMQIAQQSTEAIFANEFAIRHYSDAKEVGTIMSFQVDFVFRDYQEKINRKSRIVISIPGTKPTPRMAQYLVGQFLDKLEEGAPIASLVFARCVQIDTGQTIFELRMDPSVLENSAETED